MADKKEEFYDLNDLVGSAPEREFMTKIKDKTMSTLLNGGAVRVPGVGVLVLHSRKKRNAKGDDSDRRMVKIRVRPLDENLDIKLKTILASEGSSIFDKNN